MKSKRNKEEIRGRPPDEKARNNKEPPKPLSTKRLAISLNRGDRPCGMAGFHLRSRAHDQLREQYAPCGQRR